MDRVARGLRPQKPHPLEETKGAAPGWGKGRDAVNGANGRSRAGAFETQDKQAPPLQGIGADLD